MVIHVGISLGTNEILAYNSETNEVFNIVLEEVGPNDNHKINTIFETIMTQTDEELGYACFHLDSTYGNTIRKEIIKSENYSGFENIEIIDGGTALYLNAISQSGFKPKNGEVIWIFNGNICHIWHKTGQKANFVLTTYEGYTTEENLQQTFNMSNLRKTPNLILYLNTTIFNEDLAHAAFPECNILPFEFQSSAMAALTKARIMAGDHNVIEFDANTILLKSLDVKIDENTVMKFKERQSLPLTETITLEPTENVIKISVGTETIEHKFGENRKFSITFSVDTKGIYTIDFSKEIDIDEYIANLYKNAEKVLESNSTNFDQFSDQFSIPKFFNTRIEHIDTIGIDFGNSECSFNLGRRNISSVPSYVAYNDKNEIICGGDMHSQMDKYVSSLIFNVKEIIGKTFEEIHVDDNWPFKIVNTEYREKLSNNSINRVGIRIERADGYLIKYPEEIAAILLKNVKDEIEKFNNRPINEAVITIPTTFTKDQKAALLEAAKIAGWKIIHLLPDPVAALFGYLEDCRINPTNSNVLIFDMGNSNLSLCLYKIKNGEAIIIYNKNDSNLGGKEFDRVLFEYCKDKLITDYGVSNVDIQRTKLLFECQRVKHELSYEISSLKDSVIGIPSITESQINYIFISRKHFENLAKTLLNKIRFHLESVLTYFNNQNERIDIIINTGQSFQMPMIKKLIMEFPKFKNSHHIQNFDKIHGAACFAHYLNSTIPEIFKQYTVPQQMFDNDDQMSAVGLDLGTTRCCVSVNRKNGMETIPLDNTGERLLPSYVAYDEKHDKCGKIVIDRLQNFFKSTVFDVKRFIGKIYRDISIDDCWTFKITKDKILIKVQINGHDGEILKHPEEISAVLLKHIKKEAEAYQGKELNEVVITIPAAFTIAQRNATYVAAMIAGWKTVYFLPEPIAAGFTYFHNRLILKNTISLLFDLGGGTLDVCIFRIQNNKIEIISKNGDSNLGGRDFDNVLIKYCKKQFSRYGINWLEIEENKKYKLMLECQKIKEGFSANYEGELDVSDFDISKEGFISISLDDFKFLSRDLIKIIERIIYLTLNDISYESNQIDKVLFVGGGSRMPIVKDLLQSIFPEAEHCCEVHPDESVAIGAAYYASFLNSNYIQ